MKQDVRTIHPVDMRDHGIKSMGGHILKTEMLLDALMKKFYGPAEPVPHDNLPCRGPQIIAGKILAATIRSVAQFGTHQLDLAYVVVTSFFPLSLIGTCEVERLIVFCGSRRPFQ